MRTAFLQHSIIIALATGILACTPSPPTSDNTLLESQKIVATEPQVSHPPQKSVTFTLGSAETLKKLYSFPNSQGTKETLEETIQHYLQQRLSRDTIANGSVAVAVDHEGIYHATLRGNGDNLAHYATQIPTFLATGLVAASAVDELKAQKLWNDKEWRFFLPLGLSIVNQRSVQLLHFPPDYSLPDQDYLDSKTSQRWEKLLELNLVPSDEVTLYESILDVAPIAAPASAGGTLSDTYHYFEPYVVDMLPLLLGVDEHREKALPIVAYGGPVRSWVKEHFALSDFGVNSFDRVKINDRVSAPILGANHPSYIWYAKDNGRDAALTVMQQDLVSACWQAKMGTNPSADGRKTLSNCESYWAARPMTVCINMEIQAFDKSQSEAQAICQNSSESTAYVELP